MKITVTAEQQKVLDTIRAYYSLHGTLPTLSYIQKKLGYKYASSVQHHIVALRDKDMLDLSAAEKTRDVPLVGAVSCGPALLAEENVEAYIPVAAGRLKPNSQYFFLRASGDSMNEAGIDEGDYVLVRQQAHAQRKDRVVALIGDDATCKILDYSPDNIPMLVPASTNTVHKPRFMLEDFGVLGVVEDVIKPERRADD